MISQAMIDHTDREAPSQPVIKREISTIGRPSPVPRPFIAVSPVGTYLAADIMMWRSDYPHSQSTFPQSPQIRAEILGGVPDGEQAKPAPDRDPGSPAANRPRVQFRRSEADRRRATADPITPFQ